MTLKYTREKWWNRIRWRNKHCRQIWNAWKMEYFIEWRVSSLGTKGTVNNSWKRTYKKIIFVADKYRKNFISQDHVIDENYLKRLDAFGMFWKTWNWDETNYNLYFQIEVALTNSSIFFNVLRVVKCILFREINNRIITIDESICEKRAKSRAKYWEKSGKKSFQELRNPILQLHQIQTRMFFRFKNKINFWLDVVKHFSFHFRIYWDNKILR